MDSSFIKLFNDLKVNISNINGKKEYIPLLNKEKYENYKNKYLFKNYNLEESSNGNLKINNIWKKYDHSISTNEEIKNEQKLNKNFIIASSSYNNINFETTNLNEKYIKYFKMYFNFNININKNKILVEFKNCNILVYDLIKLYPNEWLNDNLINSYLSLLNNNEIFNVINKSNLDSVFFFNSYFFNKQILILNNNKNKFYENYSKYIEYYKNNKFYKIFKKKNLFYKNNIFIPIFWNNHWFLLYIENLKKFVESYKKQVKNKNNDMKQYFIIINYLNSIKNYNKDIFYTFKFIFTFLILEEINQNNNFELNDIKYIIENIKFYNPNIPMQQNMNDCGICLLEYIENILINKDVYINLLINKNEKWFNENNFNNKRIFYTKIICELSKNNNDINYIKGIFKNMVEKKYTFN